MAKLALRSASLRCEAHEGLDGMLFKGENLISYLKLFPEGRRAAVYSALQHSPTLEELVRMLGGFSGLLELDECHNLRVVGNQCFITEQRGFDEYVPFGLVRAYRQLEFQAESLRVALPRVDTTRLPDGYCYLLGVQAHVVPHVATMLGASPAVADVAPFVQRALEVEVVAGAGHVSLPPAPTARPICELDRSIPVGAKFCANVDPPTVGPVELCDACTTVEPMRKQSVGADLRCHVGRPAQTKDPTELNDRYPVLSSRCPAQVDLLYAYQPQSGRLLTADREVGDCHMDESHPLKPECDVVSYLTLHHCLSQPSIYVNAPYWAIELRPGESLSNGALTFAPKAPEGGVLLGRRYMEFYYYGVRDRLAVRRFDEASFTRFLHTRLAFGHASRLKYVADQTVGEYLYQPWSTLDALAVKLMPDTDFVRDSAHAVPHKYLAKDPDRNVLIGRWGTSFSLARGVFDGGTLRVTRRTGVLVSSPRLSGRAVAFRPSRAAFRTPPYAYVFNDLESLDDGGLSMQSLGSVDSSGDG